MRLPTTPEFLKFVRPIRPRGQKIMRSANKIIITVGNAGRIVNTGTSSVNSWL